MLYRVVKPVIRRFPAFVGARVMAAGLRASGVHLGKRTLFWGAPALLGDGDFLSRLTIGADCGFNVGCRFELDAPIVIGDHVAVGHDVIFRTRDPATHAVAPIEIGSGTWLGARCVIMPGVKIGAGSVIAAGVVVKESVAPDLMMTGNRKVSIARWRASPAPAKAQNP